MAKVLCMEINERRRVQAQTLNGASPKGFFFAFFSFPWRWAIIDFLDLSLPLPPFGIMQRDSLLESTFSAYQINGIPRVRTCRAARSLALAKTEISRVYHTTGLHNVYLLYGPWYYANSAGQGGLRVRTVDVNELKGMAEKRRVVVHLNISRKREGNVWYMGRLTDICYIYLS